MPSWTMATGKPQEKRPDNSPGPGAYNNDYQKLKEKSPTYPIIGRNNEIIAKERVPGPGQYNPSVEFVNQKNTFKISFGAKLPNSKLEQATNPGPGNYEIQKDILGKIGSKFGSESRNNIRAAGAYPGPGSYKLPSTVGNNIKYKFGTSQRSGEKINSVAPGPGQYEPKKVVGNEGSKPTILGRPKSAGKYAIVPGPGAYDAHKKEYIPSYKLGRELRTTGKNIINAPGPGQYKIENFDSIEKRSPTWKLGTERRNNDAKLNKSMPGPGTYNSSRVIGEGPKIMIAPKLTQASEKMHVPGPGTYCPDPTKVYKSVQQSGIGYGKRGQHENRNAGLPGPGAYQTKTTIHEGPKFGFGKEQRTKGKKATDVPGPGTYQIPTRIGQLPAYDSASKSQEFKEI